MLGWQDRVLPRGRFTKQSRTVPGTASRTPGAAGADCSSKSLVENLKGFDRFAGLLAKE